MLERLNPNYWYVDWDGLAQAALVASVAVVLALLLHRALFSVITKISRLSETQVDDLVVDRVRTPARWAMVAIALTLAEEVRILKDDSCRISG